MEGCPDGCPCDNWDCDVTTTTTTTTTTTSTTTTTTSTTTTTTPYPTTTTPNDNRDNIEDILNILLGQGGYPDPNDILNYGCWCNMDNGESHVSKGKGQPLDEIDQACQAWHRLVFKRL